MCNVLSYACSAQDTLDRSNKNRALGVDLVELAIGALSLPVRTKIARNGKSI